MTLSSATNPSPLPAFRFCLGATFTAQPLEPVIAFWARRLSLDFEVRFAPYNQIEQTLLDTHGDFASNHHGVNILLIRLEDFGQDLSRIRSNLGHLIEVARSFHSRVPSVLCLCPASHQFNADAERVREAHSIASVIANSFAEISGFHFLHYDEVQKLYPVEEYEAAGGGQLGHIPYTETYYAALGTALVRRTHAVTRRPYKVIVLDCDNTLWTGICGEDGPSGITLDDGRRQLQEFMLEQREAGMLLSIASKNNEPDVIEAFENNPGMPLQLRHFAGRRINWESKPENLAGLAKDLNLGLDSFIFVDDSGKECAEVETSAPEVLAVPLPSAGNEIRHFLEHVWAFDRPVVTDADRRRNAYYARNREFAAALQRTQNLEQFMANLDLRVRIAPLTPDQLPRVAQLTQRTNQFNFTSLRRSEPDIRRLIADNSHNCSTVEVSDRFGDYGLVGVMIFAREDSGLWIDTFLLSCRVLGRGGEHRMMAFLAELGDGPVVARFIPTAQNTPARQFLDSIGSAGGDLVYRFPVESIRGLTWKPAAVAVGPAAATPAPAAESNQRPPDYARIARTLSTTGQIVAEMRPQSRGGLASPLTETEARLAEIWADLLKAPSISPSDNFFDLGGHSLLAVLLLVRIHEAFGIELSIDDVYSGGLTLRGLAQRIELLQIGDLNSAEYAELLAEIEALSDEEARQLLAESEPEAGGL